MNETEIAGFVLELDRIDGSDGEAAHGHADAILLSAVPREIRNAYERVVDRAEFWATA